MPVSLLKFRDVVKQTSTTTGTGAFSLNPTIPLNCQGFLSAIGNANQCYYRAYHSTLNQWEIGICTVNSGTPVTLTRTAGNVVDGSAGAGVLVNFSAGVKAILHGLPAEYAVLNNYPNTFTTGTQVIKAGDDTTACLALRRNSALATNKPLIIQNETAGALLHTTAGGSLSLNSGSLVNWSSTTASDGAADVGIARNSPNTLQINQGNANSVGNVITGQSDTGTNTMVVGAYLYHTTSAVPAAGFGVRLPFTLDTTTTVFVDAGYVTASWVDATNATYKSRLTLSATDWAGTREGFRVEANGTVALVSFFGAAAVAKPTVTGSRGGNAALASVLTALANLGLITDSSTA